MFMTNRSALMTPQNATLDSKCTLSWFVSYRRLSAQFQFSLSADTLGYLSQWYGCTTVYRVARDVKPTFFQDRLLSFSYKRPPKNRIYSFLKQNSLSEQNNLFQISKFFVQKQLVCSVSKFFLESTKSSVFLLEICELNPNVLVLFLSFWIK